MTTRTKLPKKLPTADETMRSLLVMRHSLPALLQAVDSLRIQIEALAQQYGVEAPAD